jgi:hypothetical protein
MAVVCVFIIKFKLPRISGCLISIKNGRVGIGIGMGLGLDRIIWHGRILDSPLFWKQWKLI